MKGRFTGDLRGILFTQRVIGVLNLPPEEVVKTNTFTTFKKNLDKYFNCQESDLLEGYDLVDCRRTVPTLMDFMVAIPNQLLLVSLLEHLCYIYERNPRRSMVLFKLLCQKLAEVHLISPVTFSDEFSTVRLQHNQAFTNLLRAASNGLCVQGRAANGDVHPQISSRIKETLFQGQTSRYMTEFEEITSLGKGSYGKVYKVRNKLDGQFYALKKILMKKFTRFDCMKVLREVKVLAGLQHPHIVGYHTAWIEHVQPPALKSNQKSLSNLCALKGPSVQEDSRNSTVQNTQTSGSSIIFADTSSALRVGETLSGSGLDEEEMSVDNLKESGKQISIHSEDCGAKLPSNSEYRLLGVKDFGMHLPCFYSKGVSMHSNTDLSSELQVSQERGSKQKMLVEALETETQELEREKEIGTGGVEISGTSINVSSNSSSGSDTSFIDVSSVSQIHFHLVLHIQMQLCEGSLQDWILERNTRQRENLAFTCPFALVELDWTIHIFRQLLEGVRFIHSKGVMHRDLKPRNIFLHAPDCHVRIGDFGLACRDIVETSDSWPAKSTGTNPKHTSGVGTCLYASPEQLRGSHYDFKSDMYSVGIILLELFHPFGTVMERTKIITALREGHIPEDFAQQWPVQAKYIKMLTSKVASHRPSADEMLASELFCSLKVTPLQEKLEQKLVIQEQEIRSLQQKVIDQEEEIRHLKEQVKLLAREGESS
ncbi:eukaryotic translation initiation factor 2-alpha kinase 1 isoform X2 [Pristis pectinata]|uniref:eukaryotic translation initiation factor 2-alpha kinase 1 isoform X2 n=1 Tax=Pristis pectinata TaxID=685728 RepID=UPI00223DEB4D|nr:eukaryotic translation initiation factor 2-alpha kinase 1 isoform X2 [Pristis pectinata]